MYVVACFLRYVFFFFFFFYFVIRAYFAYVFKLVQFFFASLFSFFSFFLCVFFLITNLPMVRTGVGGRACVYVCPVLAFYIYYSVDVSVSRSQCIRT